MLKAADDALAELDATTSGANPNVARPTIALQVTCIGGPKSLHVITKLGES